mmetsp:Transcript_14373/g.40073  ORF Transcript_14373/g.40073 Transcript_14373/m.40073 type:complete len:241 (+) Transcript_14373:33-755(+)
MRRTSLQPDLRTAFRLSPSAARMRASSAARRGTRLTPAKRAAAPTTWRCHRHSDSPSWARSPPAPTWSFFSAASMTLPAAAGLASARAPTSMPTAFTAFGSSVSEHHSARRSPICSTMKVSPCFMARKRAVDSSLGPARSKAAMASFFEGFGCAWTDSSTRSSKLWHRSGSVEVTICRSPVVAPGNNAPPAGSGSTSARALGRLSGRSLHDKSSVGTCTNRFTKKPAETIVFIGSVASMP